jgi:transcriptional regulator with XRE-family HTH domain
MPLHELRAARHLTQQQLAQTLHMTQAAVSQLEQRTDVYLSTLENFVEAMGGTAGNVRGVSRWESEAGSIASSQSTRDQSTRSPSLQAQPQHGLLVRNAPAAAPRQPIAGFRNGQLFGLALQLIVYGRVA